MVKCTITKISNANYPVLLAEFNRVRKSSGDAYYEVNCGIKPIKYCRTRAEAEAAAAAYEAKQNKKRRYR